MLVKFKATKRRAVQGAIHKVFKTKATTDDDTFDKAVQKFRELERQLAEILKSVLGNREISERWTARNASLGCLLAAHFNSEKAENGCKSKSYEYMNAMTEVHSVVQNACTVIIEKHVVEPLDDLLKTSFPAKKRMIAEHQGLKTDLESYRRRVQRLQDKGRQGNEKDMIKLTRKLARTQAAYDQMHRDLLEDLTQTYNTRHIMMKPCFAAIIACQSVLHGELARGAPSSVSEDNSVEVEQLKQALRRLIEQGGPSMEEIAHIRSRRNNGGIITRSFKTLTKSFSSKRSLDKEAAENRERDEAGGPVPQDKHGSRPSSASSNRSPSIPGGASQPSFISEYKSDGSVSQGSPRQGDSERDDEDFNNARMPGVYETVEDKHPEAGDVDYVERVVATHSYHEGDDTDLYFSEGDVIEVLDKIDKGWWQGKNLKDGSTGLFPVTYVEALDENQRNIQLS